MLSKIRNYIAENTGILIRIDDIAENMNWNLMKQTEDLFEKHSIKPVLGVIPNNKDKDLEKYNYKGNSNLCELNKKSDEENYESDKEQVLLILNF